MSLMRERVGKGVECRSTGFFLPFGDTESLEEEIFYLAETWNWTEAEILAMPSTRRYRLILKKSNLEKRRQAEQAAAMSRARSRR